MGTTIVVLDVRQNGILLQQVLLSCQMSAGVIRIVDHRSFFKFNILFFSQNVNDWIFGGIKNPTCTQWMLVVIRHSCKVVGFMLK